MTSLLDTPAHTATNTSHVPPIYDEQVIAVSGVSKMYRMYNQPQDRLKQMLSRGRRSYGHEFWALRDISFAINRGETVGIIGRNGSGKSTLLQIIAGTLAPTKGEVAVNGRVAALLELGSGFNPEFTGRENVFMNGAMLGLNHDEVAHHFDEIASFADIGDFIDQPVKLYSSGMAVRLAFAVQVAIPKEILIIDEALSVGDMFFQAKCMTRMKQLIDDGVTVLFVSHDIEAVRSLCRRAVLLEKGNMILDDMAEKVTEQYFARKVQTEQPLLDTSTVASEEQEATKQAPPHMIFEGELAFQERAAYERKRNGKAHFANVQLLNHKGKEITQVAYNEEVTLRMAIEFTVDIPQTVGYAYHIRDINAVDVVYSDSFIEETSITSPKKGERYIIDWTFRMALRYGNYNLVTVLSIPIDLSISRVEFCDYVPMALQFYVKPRIGSYLYGSVHWDNIVQMRHFPTT
ncbi:MAG: ABC transporter ATP-binding protein [Chloroflexota bacterium]